MSTAFYRELAQRYDLEDGQARDELDTTYYRHIAARHGGPILELGCGTGRISLKLANDGHRVHGIDNSSAMLAMAERKRSAFDRAKLLTFEPLDMTTFDIGRCFGLIICPFRGFHHLLTLADQRATLKQIVQHLKPGGIFVMDLFAPSYSLIAGAPSREKVLEREIDGRRITRFDTATSDIARQRLSLELSWDIQLQTGLFAPIKTARTELRWVHRFELELLLNEAGLVIEAIYGDFDGGKFGDQSAELIVEARLPATES